MPFPIAAAGAIASGLGSLFGGGESTSSKDAPRQFNISQAPNIARLMESAPLRDKILAIMGNLVGTGPMPFNPIDLFNPRQAPPTGTPLPGSGPNPNAALGGYSQAQLSTPAGYQDNSGDITALYKKLLNQMGYNQMDQFGAKPSAPGAPAPGSNSPSGLAGGMNPNPQVPGSRGYFGNVSPLFPTQRPR
jgi:hypothetical protein